ncbi:MAG TPA: protein kinase, partial [Sandaracinaceae bacterium LLY-WYZ-13_1]|nr:protein kinase [Sandaracinaceae bacterium LLY-WYZ-13_1]
MSLESRLIGGRYEIVRKIAEGGMGAVYEAKHNLSKKSVALKVLFEHIGKDEAARQRFLREVSAPAQIGHDGIVEVYDAGFDIEDGSLFVAMELLDGDPMSDRLARGGLPLDTLLDWFEQILDPLSAAHAKGIVHRDLKPENVFMATKRDGSEVVKILDFGIARDLDASKGNVTQTGIAMGTPHYMAPEQAMSARDVTAAADVWAIGAMMYEALAGRPPFGGETASAIVVNACTKQHEPLAQLAPSVPPALGALVDRCLSKEPRDRPSDAGALLGELRRVRGEIGSVSGLAAGGFASGLPATGAPPGPTGALATGPLGGSSPHGTARVGPGTPAPGAHGTPQPGSFGSSPGQGTGPGGPLGYGTPPPGSGPGAPGYGTSPPGYGTSQPGYGTSQPGY